MNKFEPSASLSEYQSIESSLKLAEANRSGTLRAQVEKSLSRYFAHLEDEPVTNLHEMVMSEVEEPLLRAVMRYTGDNQSKASTLLGINRGTLRSKLKHYGLL